MHSAQRLNRPLSGMHGAGQHRTVRFVRFLYILNPQGRTVSSRGANVSRRTDVLKAGHPGGRCFFTRLSGRMA